MREQHVLMAKITPAVLAHEAVTMQMPNSMTLVAAIGVPYEQLQDTYIPTSHILDATMEVDTDVVLIAIKALTFIEDRWFHKPMEALIDVWGNVWCDPDELW